MLLALKLITLNYNRCTYSGNDDNDNDDYIDKGGVDRDEV